MDVELIIWSSASLYVVMFFVSLVLWTRFIERDSGHKADGEDMVGYLFVSAIISLVWPLSLPVHAVMRSNATLAWLKRLFFPVESDREKEARRQEEAFEKSQEYARLANEFQTLHQEALDDGDTTVAEAMYTTYRMYGDLAAKAKKESGYW